MHLGVCVCVRAHMYVCVSKRVCACMQACVSMCVRERIEGACRHRVWSLSVLLTFRNSCLLSLTLTATKNCSIACSTSNFMYFLGSMGKLTEAPASREGKSFSTSEIKLYQIFCTSFAHICIHTACTKDTFSSAMQLYGICHTHIANPILLGSTAVTATYNPPNNTLTSQTDQLLVVHVCSYYAFFLQLIAHT